MAAAPGALSVEGLTIAHQRRDLDGAAIILQALHSGLPAALIDPAAPTAPLAAVVPLDADTPTRLAAVLTLWRVVRGAPAPAALTALRRSRIKRMLRAVDARDAGASHRDLALVLFGPARVEAEPWKTSALRDVVHRLARDGLALVEHGYRDLLKLTGP
ncbi:hypothetical protein AS593_06575 [Caulobacter vibrioides]|nr:hypothetical protein AS593_06575 [Caulobacter vibrioides]